MLSDEIYRAKLQQTIASLEAWTGFVADVARVEESDQGSAWRLALVPHAPHACSIEIVLRADQRFDVTIADWTSKNLAIPSLDLFMPLLEAVTEGQVVKRRVASAITGLVHSVSTVVTLADGRVFADGQLDVAALPTPDTPTEIRDTHYLPYRRPIGAG